MSRPDPTPIGSIEVPADLRASAAKMRQLYIAWVQAGFTENQALVILGAMLGTAGTQGRQEP